MDRELKAFLAVARAGNLTAAADQIGLTQPALTKTIRRIEKRYGTDLFRRSKRGMILTDAGNAVLARAQAIETHHRQADEEVAVIRGGTVARFRIAAGAAYHMTIAPELIKRLSAEYPDLHIELDVDVAADGFSKLLQGHIDLLLGGFNNVLPEGIEYVEILETEITAYCCKNHELCEIDIIDPRLLRDKEWVAYKRDHLIYQHFDRYYTQYVLQKPKIRVEMDALSSIFCTVRGTKLLALAPTLLESEANSYGVRRLYLRRPIWKFMSGAAYRQSWRKHPIMVRALSLLPDLVGV